MKVERKDLDDLMMQLTITIEPEDYRGAFMGELKKYREKAAIRGFRKGKTPLSVLRKMFGRSALSEVINDVLQKRMTSYLKDEDIEILGNPIPSESQEEMDLDVKNFKDYIFVFDVGLAPTFEVVGTQESDTYDDYQVQISDEAINDQLSALRRRLGDRIEAEEDIQDDDILTIEAQELDGDEVKEGGWETAFTIMTNRIIPDTLQSEIMKMKKGGTFDFDIYQFEKDATEAYVHKYFLNLDDDEEKEIGNRFRGTIKSASRLEMAELNTAFFEKAFGAETIENEEEAKAHIRLELEKQYEEQQKGLTYRKIMDQLMEQNTLTLPEPFLKRWLRVTNESMTDKDLEDGYDDFEANLRWTLIRSKLSKDFEIDIKPDEIKEAVNQKLSRYLGPVQSQGLDMEALTMNYLSRENQLEQEYEQVLAERVFEGVVSRVSMKPKAVSMEEFQTLAKEAQQ